MRKDDNTGIYGEWNKYKKRKYKEIKNKLAPHCQFMIMLSLSVMAEKKMEENTQYGTQRKWVCGTKANHACAANGMFNTDLVCAADGM